MERKSPSKIAKWGIQDRVLLHSWREGTGEQGYILRLDEAFQAPSKTLLPKLLKLSDKKKVPRGHHVNADVG